MAVLKNKDILKMSKEDRSSKLEELGMELIKKNVQANKSGKIKAKEIKKAIARILTLNSITSGKVAK
ncbi:50S ribosomal protein L29 [Candidatus Pacearchaeota archaeon]|nr:50S ribosomal protein L29 [Candidatus Pacearchaeota archaeon]